jgi:hypothetical protein
MKVFKSVVALITLMPMAAQAQTGDQNKVEAGVRIGRVYLGDSKATVHRRLGKPTASFTSAGGLVSELWKGSQNPKTGVPFRLEVVYRRGIVAQIETTNPRFRLANGLNVNSSDSEWWDTYGDPTQRVLKYPKRNREYRYDDWKAKGIAVEQYYQLQRDGSVVSSPETLIVHRKGVAVIPDFGGVPSVLR